VRLEVDATAEGSVENARVIEVKSNTSAVRDLLSQAAIANVTSWRLDPSNRVDTAVKLQNSTDVTDTTPADELFCQATGGTITQHAWVDYPWSAIIAGDGFYYLPYRRYQSTGTLQRSAAQVFPEAAYDYWDQLGARSSTRSLRRR
jgi:hypothetical protein